MLCIRQFLELDGEFRGLAEFGEQELESAHSQFDRIWQRFV